MDERNAPHMVTDVLGLHQDRWEKVSTRSQTSIEARVA